jgi:hypothetical protein
MSIGLLLVVIGLVVAVLVSVPLGGLILVVGLILLIADSRSVR